MVVEKSYVLQSMLLSCLLPSMVLGDSPSRSASIPSESPIHIKPCEMVVPWKATTLAMAITIGGPERTREPLPEVISAEIVTHSPLTIKPCQRVNIQIEVEVERPIALATWQKVVRSMSEVVLVDGEEFRNRLSSSRSTLNSAAGFGLLDPRLGEQNARQREIDSQKETSRALIAVEFFLKLRDREYLFTEARRYDIRLMAGDQTIEIEVDVEQVTPQEREIIESIDTLSVMMFLVGPTNHQYATPEVVALVESLARKDTAYTKMLSLAVGLGKRSARRPDNFTEAGFRRRTIESAQRRFTWLNPHCSGEITSRREATAAFECGTAAGILGRTETDEKKAKQYLARQQELWRRVSESPLAFGEAARAKEYLAKLAVEAQEGPSTDR